MFHRKASAGTRFLIASLTLAQRTASLLAFSTVCFAGSAQRALVIDTVRVDGQDQPLPGVTGGGEGRLQLSPGPHALLFAFGPPDADGPPLRLQYRLEGVDDEWVEAGGEMRLSLMVLNATREVLALFESPMRGESAGWHNNPAQSQFTARKESFQLPPGAESLCVIFNSGTWDPRDGASHPTVGLAMIDDCRVWLEGARGSRRNIWPNSAFEEGTEIDQPDGHPRGWTRGPFGQKIAQIMTLPNPEGRVLALLDENPRSGSEWRCDLALEGLASPGELVTVEWKELYTVGAAGGHSADYHYVPPGSYVFRVKAVTPTGDPTALEAAIAFSIPQVFWKRAPFLALAGIGSAALVAAIARTLTRRRMQRAIERLEQQRTLERERSRIARDIHDDLGTSLTSITLLCQSVRSAVPPGSAADGELEQICRTSREMTHSMEEIVWAVDPVHDSLDSIANYLGHFAQAFLAASALRCRLNLPMQLPGQPISAEVRHNVFLAFKEALNNVVRHSGAQQVNISLRVNPKQFVLSIEDDGNGFASGSNPGDVSPRAGHGLANIRSRLAHIGGQAEITSLPGQGTRVRLLVPLSPIRGERR